MWYMWNGVGRMTSFYEIGGIILSGMEAENEYARASGKRSALEHKQRIELMTHIEESFESRSKGNTRTETKKPGLVEHYLRSLWYAGTEPARRVFESPELMIPAIKSPRSLLGVAVDITVEGLENQYDYFIKDENPWD
ncbi:MAG: hypothetical protein [Circular genetic element sp.]|nr:MAG: hypothetical protein [Circular genetic element sp.]